MKIIETNMMVTDNNIITDHQSRIIEIPNWDEYVSLFKNYNGNHCGEYNSLFNRLIGNVLPKDARLDKLEYDGYHLSCDVILWNKRKNIKLAYLIKEEE